VIDELFLERAKGQRVLILGMYIEQLEWMAARWRLPIITGKTPQGQRDKLFEAFRHGDHPGFGDLQGGQLLRRPARCQPWPSRSPAPGAAAKRRPSASGASSAPRVANVAHFYTVITRDSNEQLYAEKRQLFLTEQGYRYFIENRDY
jgi:DNA excision repair protein ERCC-3